MHEVGLSALPPMQKLVALAYANRAYDNGSGAHPPIAEVTQWTRGSEAAARKRRRELERARILVLIQEAGFRDGEWRPAEYAVDVSRLPLGDQPCPRCGEPMRTSDPRARYCSPTCRKLAWKARRKGAPRDASPAPRDASPVTDPRHGDASRTSLRYGPYIRPEEHWSDAPQVTHADPVSEEEELRG